MDQNSKNGRIVHSGPGDGAIAVLGGGPAGAAAALALARGGAAVDLYRPAKPGEKPCGGAVPAQVLPRLAGFDPEPLPAVRSPAATLENARGGRVDLALRDLRIFRRGDLDAALVAAAAAAGARLVPRRADRVASDDRGVTVASGGEARRYAWAIGADGAGGLARRSAGLPPPAASVGLGASLSGIAWDRLVLAFPGLADAYLWIFPRPGGASVGIAYGAGTLEAAVAERALGAFLDRHLATGWRDLPGPRYRFPIPVWSESTLPGVRRALGRRLLLAGDAAALADPLTREGIRYGMLSGAWAAESLLAGRPERYAERLDDELGGEMERAERAARLFYEGPVGQWMVPFARLHPGIRRVLGDLLACRQPYRGLTRRLLRAGAGLA
jgi:flavin-dependent dehydrogenase